MTTRQYFRTDPIWWEASLAINNWFFRHFHSGILLRLALARLSLKICPQFPHNLPISYAIYTLYRRRNSCDWYGVLYARTPTFLQHLANFNFRVLFSKLGVARILKIGPIYSLPQLNVIPDTHRFTEGNSIIGDWATLKATEVRIARNNYFRPDQMLMHWAASLISSHKVVRQSC